MNVVTVLLTSMTLNFFFFTLLADHCVSTMGVILSTVGVFSNVGDIMMHVGDIMNTVGVLSIVGGYHPLKFEYHGGYHDTCGEYHEYRGGCSVPWGYSNNKRFFPPWY